MEISPWGEGGGWGCERGEGGMSLRKVRFGAVLEEHAWGYAFQHLKGLEDLEVQLEISEDRIEELERVVGEMSKWEFPGSEGKVLTRWGGRVKWCCWESLDCRWSRVCGRCLGRRDNCSNCVRREIRRDAGLGPIVHSASLRWRVGIGR